MNKGIQKVFSEVPDTYELINHVLTLGLDVLWRRRACVLAASGGGRRWLDICSGTGETAILLRRLAPEQAMVAAVDFSLPMLEKVLDKPHAAGLALSVADAAALPFQEASFDLVTISFATRNLNSSRANLLASLREFHRILRQGGRFINLETSQPSSRLTRRLFHFYVRLLVRPVGSLLSGSRSAYAYLAHTIPRFYAAPVLSGIIQEAGFSRVKFHPLLSGAAAIHVATK